MGAPRGRDPRAPRPDLGPRLLSRVTRVGLSSSSVYPESTAHAFAYAAKVGYDAVEVMVIDALSQQISDGAAAVRAPRRPGLGDPRALPAVHAAGLGDRAVGQARAVRRDGRGGRRRGGRRTPAVPLAEGVRRQLRRRHRGPRGVDRHRVRGREHVSVAGLVQARRRDVPPRLGPLRGALRQHHHRPLARRDRGLATRSRWPTGSATRLRHVHLTDGTGSAKDEHLVPGRGSVGAAEFLQHLARTGFGGEIVVEINTRKAQHPHRARGRPPRVAGVRPRALPRRPARASRTPAGPADQSRLVRRHDQLGTVAGAELEEQPRHVGLGGERREHQVLGDLLVRHAAADQGEDLALARREVGEDRLGGGAVVRRRELLGRRRPSTTRTPR